MGAKGVMNASANAVARQKKLDTFDGMTIVVDASLARYGHVLTRVRGSRQVDAVGVRGTTVYAADVLVELRDELHARGIKMVALTDGNRGRMKTRSPGKAADSALAAELRA